MRFGPSLVFAEHETVASLPLSVAITFAAAVALAALLGRRRMPAGLGEGAFVAAVSGALLVLFALDRSGGFARPMLDHVLTGLAVFWYALGRLGVRRRPFGRKSSESVAADEAASERSRVWDYAALVCGLAALVNMLVTPSGLTLAGWSAANTDFVVLLVLSVLVWVFRAGPWAGYPLVTLLVCLLTSVVLSGGLGAEAVLVGVAMNGVSLLSLAVVIGTVLVRWWRRRRRWLEDPQSLVEPSPAYGALFALLVGVGALVGLLGLVFREAALTPTAVLLAALTCLTIGHLRAWLIAGEIGLILVAEGVVTAAMGWLRPGWSGALFGLGLAGGYLLWLARFWNQQLNDGQPWTTAGRLIPISRRLAYMAYVGAFTAAIGCYVSADSQTQPVWITAVTVGLLLGGMMLLVRDGFEHRQPGAAFAACLAVLAAMVPAGRLLFEATMLVASPVVLVAAGAWLLALWVAVTPHRPPAAAVYNALIGGALPVVVLFALTLRGFDAQGITAVVLAVAAALVHCRVLFDG